MKGGDASEIDSFLGPWAKYQDEKDVAKPSEVRARVSSQGGWSRRRRPSLSRLDVIPCVFFFGRQEMQKELDEITAKRQKKGKNEEEAPGEEKTILHGENLSHVSGDAQFKQRVYAPKVAAVSREAELTRPPVSITAALANGGVSELVYAEAGGRRAPAALQLLTPSPTSFLCLSVCCCFLPVKDAYDYQGRSYLHIPQDVGINLRSADIPDKCYLPKKQLHVWTGHTKVSRGFYYQ